MTFEQWWEENKDRVAHINYLMVVQYFAETAWRVGYAQGYEAGCDELDY